MIADLKSFQMIKITLFNRKMFVIRLSCDPGLENKCTGKVKTPKKVSICTIKRRTTPFKTILCPIFPDKNHSDIPLAPLSPLEVHSFLTS